MCPGYPDKTHTANYHQHRDRLMPFVLIGFLLCTIQMQSKCLRLLSPRSLHHRPGTQVHYLLQPPFEGVDSGPIGGPMVGSQRRWRASGWMPVGRWPQAPF